MICELIKKIDNIAKTSQKTNQKNVCTSSLSIEELKIANYYHRIQLIQDVDTSPIEVSERVLTVFEILISSAITLATSNIGQL